MEGISERFEEGCKAVVEGDSHKEPYTNTLNPKPKLKNLNPER